MAIGEGWVDGAWVDAGWVTGAWAQPTATKTIGGTSQLGALTSTGGITVQSQKTIGATSQLGALSSTGGLNIGWQIGGTSQIGAFSASGGITVGDAAVPANPSTSAGSGRGSRIYLPPAPTKKKPGKSKLKAESEKPAVRVVEREPLQTPLGDFQSRISETPEIPFPFGDTLKNLENLPEPSAPLSADGLTQLIASLVESRVTGAMAAESMRQDGLKILAALEKELDEDEPLDPKVEEFLLLLLLV